MGNAHGLTPEAAGFYKLNETKSMGFPALPNGGPAVREALAYASGEKGRLRYRLIDRDRRGRAGRVGIGLRDLRTPCRAGGGATASGDNGDRGCYRQMGRNVTTRGWSGSGGHDRVGVANCRFTVNRSNEEQPGAFFQLIKFDTVFAGELLNIQGFGQTDVKFGKEFTFEPMRGKG